MNKIRAQMKKKEEISESGPINKTVLICSETLQRKKIMAERERERESETGKLPTLKKKKKKLRVILFPTFLHRLSLYLSAVA